MIKLSYDSKDAIPDGFASLYTEKDGKFVLTGVDGMKTQSDVDNIQEALRKERALKKDAESKLAAYDGIEADGLRDSLDELERLRVTNGKVDDSKLNEMVESRLKLDREKYKRETEKLESQIQELTGKNENLVNEKNTNLIEDGLREAGRGVVSESAMNDVLFRKSLFEVSEEGNVLTKENAGVTPGLSPSQWMEEAIKNNTHWAKTSKGAGAKGNAGHSTAGVKGERAGYAEIMSDSGVEFN